MASFNPTSINTLRMITYRKPDKTIKVQAIIQRFGKPGAVVDNASSGGSLIGINFDGTLKSRLASSYKSMRRIPLGEEVTDKIPFIDELKNAVITLHQRVVFYDLIGWDMIVTPDGCPTMIEMNTQPAIEVTQLAHGPLFSREELDEIMPEVMKYKTFKSYNFEIK